MGLLLGRSPLNWTQLDIPLDVVCAFSVYTATVLRAFESRSRTGVTGVIGWPSSPGSDARAPASVLGLDFEVDRKLRRSSRLHYTGAVKGCLYSVVGQFEVNG